MNSHLLLVTHLGDVDYYLNITHFTHSIVASQTEVKLVCINKVTPWCSPSWYLQFWLFCVAPATPNHTFRKVTASLKYLQNLDNVSANGGYRVCTRLCIPSYLFSFCSLHFVFSCYCHRCFIFVCLCKNVLIFVVSAQKFWLFAWVHGT